MEKAEPATVRALSRGRRILFSGVYLVLSAVVSLILLEVLLTAFAHLEARRHPAITAPTGRAHRVVLCLGDSVTYGFGVSPGESYPGHLQAMLRERGQGRVVVENLAHPGARTPEVFSRQITRLETLDTSVERTLLLLVGHNDFVRLEVLRRFQGPRAADGNYLASNAADEFAFPLPRSLRALRWVWQVALDRQGMREIDPGRAAPFRSNLRAIRDAVHGRGARLVLLTYLVPGPPPDDLPQYQLEPIQYMRRLQLDINTLIRQNATTLEIPLIDLARLVPLPTRWSRDTFLDSIHPTADTHARMAEAVYQQLYGERPLSSRP